MEKVRKLSELHNLAETAWLSKAKIYAEFLAQDQALEAQCKDLSRTTSAYDIHQQIAGFEKTREDWRGKKLRELNMVRARLKATMALAEPELRGAFGKKTALKEIIRRESE